MTLHDWTTLSTEAVAPLYRRERVRWARRLRWDTSSTWQEVEQARVSWGLPGVACADAEGETRGWSFYLRRGHQSASPRRLDVGALVSDCESTTEALLDELITRAGGREGVRGFVYATAVGLETALHRCDLRAQRYGYLSRDTAMVDAEDCRLAIAERMRRQGRTWRQWRADDLEGAARLLQRAYGDAGVTFAPTGRFEEWREYLANLVTHSGCGRLHPALSTVVTRGTRIEALTLVTSLGCGTAHLAQLAVDPVLRGQKTGELLVARAVDAAHSAGFRRLTLLAADANGPAVSLYRRLGFQQGDRFISIG